MLRTVLWNLFLLALPFLLYAAYVALARRERVRAGEAWDQAPLSWLFIAGVVLVIASFLVLGLVTEDPGEGRYVPARYEDGRIVPGEVR